jgi:hypothetical protein
MVTAGADAFNPADNENTTFRVVSPLSSPSGETAAEAHRWLGIPRNADTRGTPANVRHDMRNRISGASLLRFAHLHPINLPA